mgnify:CR=1 FL=1
MVKPEQYIRSHMPFDPLFQFLNYPLTYQEFNQSDTKSTKNKTFFNYRDTLTQFENQNQTEKCISENRRIEHNGIKNDLIIQRMQYNQLQINFQINQVQIDNYNLAINDINNGIAWLNKFINYRNKQFIPSTSDLEIKNMLDSADILLTNARKILKGIKNPDDDLILPIYQLNITIDKAKLQVTEQKKFLDKYLKTEKTKRKTLFY